MKIILAAPLYPPEVGGPSQYAYKLAEAFRKLGHEVRVVRFAPFRTFPSGLRHALYACALLVSSLGADAIIAFDTSSVGVPAAAVSSFLGIPLIIRIGGDFLWESYVNRTGTLVPLPQFYDIAKSWNRKERAIYTRTRRLLARAIPVFNSAWLRDIWIERYAVDPSRAHVVEN